MLLGEGTVSVWGLVYTVGITFALFFMGLLVFNKTEKSFIDTV